MSLPVYMGVRWMSDGCQMDVRWMSDGCQICHSSVHKTQYTMTCLSGDCVVLMTITRTSDSYTGYGCKMDVRWVSDGCQ